MSDMIDIIIRSWYILGYRWKRTQTHWNGMKLEIKTLKTNVSVMFHCRAKAPYCLYKSRHKDNFPQCLLANQSISTTSPFGSAATTRDVASLAIRYPKSCLFDPPVWRDTTDVHHAGKLKRFFFIFSLNLANLEMVLELDLLSLS